MYLGKKVNKVMAGFSATLLREKVWGLPTHIQIEPTDRCNLRCVMCPRTYMSEQREYHDLSLADFKKILNQIPTLKTLQLSGWGEPLLNKDFTSMIKFAHQRGIKVATNSNGTLFRERNIGNIIDSGLDFLKISIDSPDPETYRKIRCTDIEPVKTGVKHFVQEMKNMGAKKPRLSLNVVLMKENVSELDQFFDFAHEIGIENVRFKPVNVMDMGIDSLRVKNVPSHEILKKARDKADRYIIQSNLDEIGNLTKGVFKYCSSGDKSTKKFIPCYMLWSECFISAAGNVRPCCEFYTEEYSMGNALEEAFEQIWNGSKYRDFRKKTARGFMPVECKSCNRFYPNYVTFEKIKIVKRRLGPFGRIIKTEF